MNVFRSELAPLERFKCGILAVEGFLEDLQF